MSKNKNITWDDIRVYKKLPNRKKAILTNEFLTTFKDELINVFPKTETIEIYLKKHIGVFMHI